MLCGLLIPRTYARKGQGRQGAPGDFRYTDGKAVHRDLPMSAQLEPRYDFETYLAMEREAVDVRHEYVDGEVFAMVGTTLNHNLIVTNLVVSLGAQLRDRPCYVFSNDLKVRIETADAVTYPDLSALCGEPRLYDERKDVLLNPNLIIEVLSPSTEAWDRGGKFAIYRQIATLEEYLLVSQDRPLVERYRRRPEGWVLSDYRRLEDEVALASIQCRLVLAEVYAKVDLDTPIQD